jgi:ubiquinone/menaquinone biosynthesis C-methylase UbiE
MAQAYHKNPPDRPGDKSAMIRLAEKNSHEYNLSERVIYKEGNAFSMPFPQKTFDFAFSNGSLHEWEDPEKVFSEIFGF